MKVKRNEPIAFSILIISIAFLVSLIVIVLPVYKIFEQAFQKGFSGYWNALVDLELLSSLRLSLIVMAIVVTINTIFGLAAAWYVTRFGKRIRGLLEVLLELPFSVSPVVAGMIFILLFGSSGFLGSFLKDSNVQIIFALPGVILATTFVTLPFVAKELIPLMDELGTEMEEAAIVLGANGWHMFTRITLPSIKWGLIHGIIMCTARSMGEFGAVSVVSGHIRGQTVTMPLHIEILYNEYEFVASFAAATILGIAAFAATVFKILVSRAQKNQLRKS
ncbi:MAG: sulfate ABC transporter permease subunit CysW [Leptospiraceae bacterium]|nr:sulfate ABC transporter permease subunit CysW [Leptospiraceae bacterium]MCB1201969.1 sulfate ABC transporter permease subunit CysW [Leptospiraceae bacterium]